jgi:AcrR family transcriptional regulator
MNNSKQKIIETARLMIQEKGLINLSRKDLCNRVGIPDGSFVHIMNCTFNQFVLKLRQGRVESIMHDVNKTRVEPNLRRDQLLKIAVLIATNEGYNNLTREMIADRANVSVSLITRYFGTMTKLKRDVMRYAIKNEIPEIIAQGLAIKDSHAIKAPQELKAKAAIHIAGY